jgi:hypothetical protein
MSLCLWWRFWGVGEGRGRWSNGRPINNGKSFSFSNQLMHFSLDTICLRVKRESEVLKPKSLLIKLSLLTRGPKNYSRPWVFTSYFYVHFRATTVVVDGRSIFEILRVGEEIWVRFFWAKGLGRSWFYFFSWRGGGGGGGVLGVLIGGSEPEWEMRRTGWGGSTGCIMHWIHTSSYITR